MSQLWVKIAANVFPSRETISEFWTALTATCYVTVGIFAQRALGSAKQQH